MAYGKQRPLYPTRSNTQFGNKQVRGKLELIFLFAIFWRKHLETSAQTEKCRTEK
jgi:hypothetical protein